MLSRVHKEAVVVGGITLAPDVAAKYIQWETAYETACGTILTRSAYDLKAFEEYMGTKVERPKRLSFQLPGIDGIKNILGRLKLR